MSQFIRPVDKHVEDLLVPDIEALRHLSDELNHHIPVFFVKVSWTLSAITSLKRPPMVS